MSGRPPLPVGAHGNITTRQLGDKLWEARCRYRSPDGETRHLRRRARSRAAAENAVKVALSERRQAAEAHLGPDSRVRDAAAHWFAQRQAQQEAGELAHPTLTVYRSAWTLYIEPALGGLRLREVTVARCEVWKLELRKRKGASATKSARTVLSGILGYAARMGAIPANPVRDISPIPGGRRRPPRAMTRDERARWLAAMEADEKAARWAIPDLTRFMLATGCRISEALAVSWDEVDLEAGTVAVRWHLVPVRGVGLQRVAGAKSAAGTRTLQVPRWCVDMLLGRRVAEDSGYPVFPDELGGWRWPGNVARVMRQARDAAGFGWVTSHVFRKTCVTVLDEAGLSARAIADVAGHADPSMTQRVYMGRGIASAEAAAALEDLL
ncbi:tyrosine-type recombinase/integrase [Pseudonocardia asaccharolytica]|uniref:Phage integrase n=1 Tax=Pseudonocardia asaccharolytica DSM 44247 = NBRC 16224 TaxID=1123024 RepID=A0A511D424_9PSEU|nr:site-specific integrase [Pseudonocardia asaccharolytica]GEL17648.1 phage integrase [Pseudonocardia asaccharolytica DSM 44247 = NBRC 16224]